MQVVVDLDRKHTLDTALLNTQHTHQHTNPTTTNPNTHTTHTHTHDVQAPHAPNSHKPNPNKRKKAGPDHAPMNSSKRRCIESRRAGVLGGATPSILARLPLALIKHIKTFTADQRWLPINILVSGRLTGATDVYRQALSIRLADCLANTPTVLARFGTCPEWRLVAKQHIYDIMNNMLADRAIADWFVVRPTDCMHSEPVGAPNKPGGPISYDISGLVAYLESFPLLLGNGTNSLFRAEDRAARTRFDERVEAFHIED